MKILYLLFSLTIGLSMSHAQDAKFKIANKFHLEGDAGWDYLYSDDLTGNLYVSHGTMVQVMDQAKGVLVGTISGMKGVHGIALVSNFNKGYISSGKDSMVTVFDSKNFNVITKITVGIKPDAIMFDPFSQKVFAFNAGSNNVSVIDPTSDHIIATIQLESNPEFAVSDNNGKVFVNLEDNSKLAVINSRTLKVESNWSLSPGEGPSGLALDNENHRLFSVCSNKLMIVLDAISGKIITTVPIGEHVDGAGFDPTNKHIYASCGEGKLTVIQQKNANNYTVLENVPTMQGAKTIAANIKTHHVFLSTAEFLPAQTATAENPKPKALVKPNTFVILDIVAKN